MDDKKGTIYWADFREKTPNYGDLIVLRYAPESKASPVITIYDRYTEWLDGDVYAVIKNCRKLK